ncbi:hypothetical protein DSECCO2_421530 [anaerobic digester metagenome]
MPTFGKKGNLSKLPSGQRRHGVHQGLNRGADGIHPVSRDPDCIAAEGHAVDLAARIVALQLAAEDGVDCWCG